MKHASARITITTWHKNPKTTPTARRMGASANARMHLAADAMTFDLLPKTNMQSLNIDVTKIDKAAIYEGKKGKYITLTLMDNRDGVDQYGNDGFVVQDIGKQRRDAGERGPIVGNWKHVGQSKPAQRQAAPQQSREVTQDDEECPF